MGVTDAFLNLLKSNGGELTKGMTYDKDNGITILSDTVDKLREEIKKQYNDYIGLFVLEPEGTPQSLLSSAKYLYEHEEDFQSDYADIKDRDFVFSCMAYNGLRMVVRYVFSDTPSYFYWNGKDPYHVDNTNLVVMNSDFEILSMDYVSYYSTCKPENIAFRNSVPLHSSDLIVHNGTSYSGLVHYYSDKNVPIKIWSSYEALYNYLHGSQNAYLSSKVEEKGEDIKISIDDMNTNISDKMDSLIDSINNKKEGMSADELQKAIDKGLENISGKMDDIKNNTEETNNKLDSLLTVMQSQNEILMNILGVTTDIYNVVSSNNKEDGTNYTIADLKPHFNKCFTAVKNMVLYGESSFEDVGTQSVMNVDNDVGIAVYADDPENHIKDYHNGLLGKFPFCVPYQLYEWLQVLQADPKTPEFTYDYGYMLKYFGVSSDTDTVIKFDLSQYDEWAKNARSFLKLSFTLALAVGTYRKFKGEI